MNAERTLRSALAHLNNAQRGSFGEFVFGPLVTERGRSVARHHRERTDFLVDGVPVDVKTTVRGLKAKTKQAGTQRK